LHLDLPGAAGDVGWPRTLRGAPAGHSDWPGRKTIDRPSRASRRSPGTKTKVRNPGERGDQPLHRATWCHSPGRVVIAVRSLPWPRPSRPVDTKSMCPLSVLPSPPPPPSLLDGAAVKLWAAIEIRGEGRTPGALREGLPPKPPIKERPNYLGGTRPRQGPSLSLEAIGRRRHQTARLRWDGPTP
jgi:hypothetical protein